MTIALVTNPGGIFKRLGRIGAALRTVNGSRGDTPPASAGTWGTGGPSIKALKTAIDDIFGQYNSSLSFLTDSLYSTRTAYLAAHSSYLSALKTLAQNTLVEQVFADVTLNSKDVATCLAELIRQMKASSDTVQANTVGVTVTAAAANIGSAQLVASVTGANGLSRQYVFPETIKAVVGGDRYTATAAGGQEPVAVAGASAIVTDKLAYNWPTASGSGAAASLTMVDAAQSNAGGNLLNNSSFETYAVANTPDNFTIVTGTAGTSIKKNATVLYGTRGLASLEIVGDGSELTTLTQTFAVSSAGTAGVLAARGVYALNLFLRMSATPTAGVVTFSLVDGSGTVINDDAGTANTITKVLTAVSTTFVPVNGFFRMPSVPPTTVKLRIKLTTSIDSGKSLYLDDMALALATELYTGGPLAAVFRGAVDVAKGDNWSLVATNDLAGIFQTLFEQMFDMRAAGLQLPSAASSPTVADTLVS